MSDTAVTAFLDRERTFDLAPHMLELERITGAGVGRVVARVISGEFRAADLAAVVRLGLIGGGETPKDAAALVATYVTGRPLSEAHALATTIVMALWAGKPKAAPLEEAKALDQLIVVHPGGREEILWTEGAV